MATLKQKKVAQLLLENVGMSVSEAMRRAGYTKNSARNSHRIVKTPGWAELMDFFFDEEAIARKHQNLLNAHRIDHMVFPLAMTDEEIVELLASCNCKVKKFMHSETQTHVWYFNPDNLAQDKALDKIYKLRGQYAAEKLDVSTSLSLADLYDKALEKKAKTKPKKK